MATKPGRTAIFSIAAGVGLSAAGLPHLGLAVIAGGAALAAAEAPFNEPKLQPAYVQVNQARAAGIQQGRVLERQFGPKAS